MITAERPSGRGRADAFVPLASNLTEGRQSRATEPGHSSVPPGLTSIVADGEGGRKGPPATGRLGRRAGDRTGSLRRPR